MIAVHPAAPRVAHLDAYPVALDAVAGVLLAIRGGRNADVADYFYVEAVANRRQQINQMRLDNGAGAAAHHRQVHHQGEGLPIHQVGGGAVVGAREIHLLADPICATDPEPATRGQGLLLHLHAAQQFQLRSSQLAQLVETSQVALHHLLPTFSASGGLAGIGAVKDRIGRWRPGGEVMGEGATRLAGAGGARWH